LVMEDMLFRSGNFPSMNRFIHWFRCFFFFFFFFLVEDFDSSFWFYRWFWLTQFRRRRIQRGCTKAVFDWKEENHFRARNDCESFCDFEGIWTLEIVIRVRVHIILPIHSVFYFFFIYYFYFYFFIFYFLLLDLSIQV
jgi:hypothetical protein